jgi:ABC-type branched-subunit amino acid transport system ATPase component/ABC-type branched-subunit amino acid transport system permease subunit
MNVLGFELDANSFLLGGIVGIPYGLLAVGLVLIYKVSKFVNFAQGALGSFGGALVALLVTTYGVPYWAAFVIGVAMAALVAATTEVVIVRRLDGLPRLMGVVVTLLLSSFLLGLSSLINADAQFVTQFPKPAGFPSFEIGDQVYVESYTAILVLSPFVIVGLALLLKRSRFGLSIRATAANPDAAWTVGIAPMKVSARTWALAGAVAAFSAILLGPTTLGILGPGLMLRGLVAAAIARFSNVWVAFASGIAIGVLDTAVQDRYAASGVADVVLVVVALAVLLVRPPRMGRESEDDGNWTRMSLPRLDEAYRPMWPARNFGLVMGAVMVVFMAVVTPTLITQQGSFIFSTTMAIGIVGLSVLVLTGRAGQLSLGQFAVAGIAAVVSVKVVDETGVFVLGVAAAAATGAVVTLVLGLPALRTRGLVFAITTLAFAIATRTWVLPQDWAMGDGIEPAKPVLGSIRLDDPRGYYQFALAMLAITALCTLLYVRSRSGRELVALRDNENAARALGVPALRRKVEAFLVAGALAGVGGSVFAHGRDLITPSDFEATASIDVVVFAVVGGLAVVSGPIVGATFGVALPQLMSFNAEAVTGLNLFFLVLILAQPGGLVSIFAPTRDWLVEEYARLRGMDPVAIREAVRPPRGSVFRDGWGRLAMRRAAAATDSPLLEVESVGKSYGGITAVREVSLSVRAGEAVAVVGPNGAGKTTLFEMVSGFVRPDAGRVRLAGRDVTGWSAERRARAGLVRSFQNALLFPTLTVEDALRVAARRRGRDGVSPEDVLTAMGLAQYRDDVVSTLPTGVRRVLELACDIVVQPRVLLLDEPSAGIAHAEIPRLAELLRTMRDEWGLTLVVVDHDMNLLGSVCDRFVAMELGQVIAEGTAEEVHSDERVIESFLGGSIAAIERSAAPA